MGVFITLKDDMDRDIILNTDTVVMIESAVRDDTLELSFVYTQHGPGQRTVKHTPEAIKQMIDEEMAKYNIRVEL